MIYDKVAVREQYYNGFTDLILKYRAKDKDKTVYLYLLLIFFMEYFSNPTQETVELYVPFISKIKNIDNTRAVIKAVENGINGKGKLKNHINEFVEINKNEIDYLTNIIPQKEPKINIINEFSSKKKLDYIAEIKLNANRIEEFNNASVYVNQKILNKNMKQWNTQRDSRVRKTTFHMGIDRLVVGINQDFQVGEYKAYCPADSKLPSWERYNCRCYLTFI